MFCTHVLKIIEEFRFFFAGAHSNNFLPIPTALLWIREHNRVAGQLAILNPHWNDERLFDESRRIVGAEIQHITYTEYLPILLGKDVMTRYCN